MDGQSPNGHRIRVMIVEDHIVVSQGLTALLNDQADMAVVGTAGSMAESLLRAEQHEPDVLLLDFRLPDGSGTEAGRRIRQLHPDVKLIILSHDDSDAAHMAAVEAGASAFLHKSRAAAEVVEAIRAVARGINLVSPQMIAALLGRQREATAQVESLTERERDVLRHVAKGISSREIARELGISYTTVRTHIRSLGRKLGVHSKIEAIAKARDLGLVE